MSNEPGELNDLVTGFEGYYRVSLEMRQEAYKAGLIVLDASAMLDVYRLSPKARLELLQLLRAVQDKIFVPYQVALEFHRRRVDAVASRTKEFQDQANSLQRLLEDARGIVRLIARRAHGRDDEARDAIASLESSFVQAARMLEGVESDYDLDPDKLARASSDEILEALREILENRVALRPTDEVLSADEREAQRRIDETIPPGFADRGKKEGAAGDYLWWAEALRHAEQVKPKYMLIISNDITKGDWTFERRGFRIGPDPRLVEEVRNRVGAILLLATTSEFLAEAPEVVGTSVSEHTVEEARSLPIEDVDLAVIEAIRQAVRSSKRPLVSAAAAQAALKVDPSLPASEWAGAGTFVSFLRSRLPELRYVQYPSPGYIYDPEIHLEADLPSSGFSSALSKVGPVITEICQRTGTPALLPEEYQAVFRGLATDIAENGLDRNEISRRVRDRLSAEGINIGRANINFVAQGLIQMNAGSLSSAQPAPEALAADWRSHVLALCAEAGLNVDDGFLKAIDEWLLGGTGD